MQFHRGEIWETRIIIKKITNKLSKKFQIINFLLAENQFKFNFLYPFWSFIKQEKSIDAKKTFGDFFVDMFYTYLRKTIEKCNPIGKKTAANLV